MSWIWKSVHAGDLPALTVTSLPGKHGSVVVGLAWDEHTQVNLSGDPETLAVLFDECAAAVRSGATAGGAADPLGTERLAALVAEQRRAITDLPEVIDAEVARLVDGGVPRARIAELLGCTRREAHRRYHNHRGGS